MFRTTARIFFPLDMWLVTGKSKIVLGFLGGSQRPPTKPVTIAILERCPMSLSTVRSEPFTTLPLGIGRLDRLRFSRQRQSELDPLAVDAVHYHSGCARDIGTSQILDEMNFGEPT